MKFNLCFLSLAASCFVLFGCSKSESTLSPAVESSSSIVVVPTSSGGTAAVLPSGANSAYATLMYSTWKANAVISMQSEMASYPTLASSFTDVFSTYISASLYPARIRWDMNASAACKINDPAASSDLRRGCTVSEGIGYGMLISLFQGDWDTFNRLWYYNRGYRSAWGSELMPWQTNTFILTLPSDYSSATDADLDIATSLILAYYKTQNADYLTDALKIVSALWTEEVNPANLYLYSGNSPTWTTDLPIVYNPSYFSPVALRLFAEVDKTHDWVSVLAKNYAYMQTIVSKSNGLIPDWTDESGSAVNPPNSKDTYHYWQFFQESVRVPWRLAWDYYWTQDPRAKTILDGMAAFIAAKSGNTPSAIPAVYYSTIAGSSCVSASGKTSTYPCDYDLGASVAPIHFLGAWCLTGMAGYNNYAWMNACTDTFNARTMASAYDYFPQILQMMYSELLNGLFVKPAGLSF